MATAKRTKPKKLDFDAIRDEVTRMSDEELRSVLTKIAERRAANVTSEDAVQRAALLIASASDQFEDGTVTASELLTFVLEQLEALGVRV